MNCRYFLPWKYIQCLILDTVCTKSIGLTWNAESQTKTLVNNNIVLKFILYNTSVVSVDMYRIYSQIAVRFYRMRYAETHHRLWIQFWILHVGQSWKRCSFMESESSECMAHFRCYDKMFDVISFHLCNSNNNNRWTKSMNPNLHQTGASQTPLNHTTWSLASKTISHILPPKIPFRMNSFLLSMKYFFSSPTTTVGG